ncbi:MAG TPA: diaminopimelate epimerase [Streptosporangiaceae bacterium]|nr:diaminopimelate epimerase [Streptosporangiaceae bacterium]
MRFTKGQGTGNDFVILADLDDELKLTPALVSALCDRHTGIGADGVLRVALGDGVPWFMDYVNADGSVAEMCGNGIRVFARYLTDHGLATGPELVIGTRAGVRVVRWDGDELFSVDMGPATVTGAAEVVIAGRRLHGSAVNVGNPHLACLVTEPLAGFDLSEAPVVDQEQFPAGANVEIVRVVGERSVQMRVSERGSGETMSCGTGAVAAAVVAADAAGLWPEDGGGVWKVEVPGGVLAVAPGATASTLTGPAVIVAEGDLDPRWLRAVGAD